MCNPINICTLRCAAARRWGFCACGNVHMHQHTPRTPFEIKLGSDEGNHSPLEQVQKSETKKKNKKQFEGTFSTHEAVKLAPVKMGEDTMLVKHLAYQLQRPIAKAQTQPVLS